MMYWIASVRKWITPARFIGLILLTGAVAMVVGRYHGNWVAFETDFFANIVTDIFGLVFAVLVIDALNDARALRERKEELILQVNSPDYALAMEALRILRLKGWLQDGTLNDADLKHAGLPEADLRNATMRRASLIMSNLKRAELTGSDLNGADLGGVDLEGAVLSNANLEGAVLQGTILVGANLWNANLWGATLRGPRLDETTILPDGSTWSPEEDLLRFTDPHHPVFWRSGDSLSPAFRGK